MKINLIGNSVDASSGQGIYRYSAELLAGLRDAGADVSFNDNGDINHIQQPEIIWKHLFKKNVITTIHDVIPLFNNERKILFRIFFYISVLISTIKSNKIIAVSECTKRDIIKYFPWVRKKIRVIYESIDHNLFYPNKRKKGGNITIGYVGGLGKIKNVGFRLKIAKKYPKINFKIAGAGKEKEKLIKLSKNLKLKNVEFCGFVSEGSMRDFYNSLDIFIFPFLYEGFGLPVLEAMACGTPVLVSNKGSLPEIVPNENNIIDIENIIKTKNRIIFMVKSRKRLNSLTQESIKRAALFSRYTMIKKTVEFYKNGNNR